MDAITAGFLAAAAVGACAAIAHMFGYVPPRYKRVLASLQADFAQRITEAVAASGRDLPTRVGSAVESALERVSAQQVAKWGDGIDDARQAQDALVARFDGIQASLVALPSAFGAEIRKLANEQAQEMKAQADAMMAQAASADKSQAMSMVGALGNAAQLQSKTTRMLAEGMMGSWLPILRTVLPGVADQLEENPELIFSLIENPFFKKHILPRIQQFIGSKSEPSSGDNPFLGELR